MRKSKKVCALWLTVCIGVTTGLLCFNSVNVSAATVSGQTEESNLEEKVLYSGSASASAWTVATSIYASSQKGGFAPECITADGYFRIEYSGTKAGISLGLNEWTSKKWATVLPSESGATESGYYSTFTYEDCVKAYGKDFSDLDAICACAAATEVTVTSIKWYGHPLVDDLGADAILYKGSATAEKKNSCLTYPYIYTKHVGGTFDAAAINEDSYFYIEYKGNEGDVYLALCSASGATNWVAVYPSESGMTKSGYCYSKFNYSDFSKKFGTNFARLDEVLAYSATDSSVTLRRIAYFAGSGNPVDSSNGIWDRSKTGIAFIGDSIVQNALLSYGDWNTILGRTDCANYGIGGQTTVNVEARIDDLLKGSYDKIVILCGINDIGAGVELSTTIANYKSMFEKISKALPNSKVYVISVLPTTPVFFNGYQYRITDMDDALQALIKNYDFVTYIDCYSKFIGDDGYCISDYVSDGLHPNKTGYQVISNVLLSYLGENIIASVEQRKGLQELYNTQVNYTQVNYSIASWSTFATALEYANTIINKTDATQAEVDTAKANLQSAIKGLTEKSEPSTLMLGDVNTDGVINLVDYMLLQKYLKNPTSAIVAPSNADVNSDGKISIADLLALRKIIIYS